MTEKPKSDGRTAARKAGTDVTAPLAPTQRRLWLSEQLLPGQAEYNVVDCWSLTGALDIQVLEAAVRDVTERHEALRTTFHLENGEPVQRIHPVNAIWLDVVPGELDEEVAQERVEHLARMPFVLSSAPLVRWTLVRTAPDRHLLQLVVHHLVIDGWSLEILVDDLAACYAARQRGEEPLPPDPAVPYHIYASRRSGLRAPREQIRYWKEVLKDLPPPPSLPMAGRSSAGPPVRQSLPVEPELVARIKQLARAEGVTSSAVWLSCFAGVLVRWGGSRDVVVGSPFSGRTAADLLRTVGFFIATVALRLKVPEGATGREVLRQARQILQDAQINQDVTFDEVVAEVMPQRRPDAAPPFAAWFNMLNYPTRPLRLGAATGERLPAPAPGLPFGLALYVDQRLDSGTRLDLVHDITRLERPYAKALLEQILVLARALTRDVTTPIDAVDLTGGHAAAPAAPAPLHVEQGMLERLRSHPAEDLAVVDDDTRWSYGELLAAADDITRRLQEAGLTSGDLVEITDAPGRRLPAAILGVWGGGGVFLVSDPSHPSRWREKLRRQARPRFLLTYTGSGTVLVEAESADLPPAERVQTVGLPDTGQPLYLLPTSGTTGEPRLVLGSELPLLAFLHWWSLRYAIGPGDRFHALSGLSHDPLLRDLLLPLWNGGVLTVPPAGRPFDPDRTLEQLITHRVTVLHATPLVGRLLAQAARRVGARLDQVRMVCFGGDALDDETIAAWRDIAPTARILSLYGTTETPQAASCLDVPPGEFTGGRGETPLGHGAVEAQLVVLTRTGAPAACGELGEIAVRSRLLSLGYLDDGPATESAYCADPWGDPGLAVFRTGDIGRLSWDGTVFFAGRDAAMVKVRGHRLALPQLAAELRSLPGVVDAAVTQRRTETQDARLVAYVVAEPGRAMVPSRITAALAEAVPSGYLPDEICLLDALPLTPNGKLDTARLPAGSEAATARPELARRSTGRRSAVTERMLARIWGDVLGLAHIDVDENFFDLGGTSATAVGLRSRLERELNRELSPLLVFQSPTIRRMADQLSGSTPASKERPAAMTVIRTDTRELRRSARAALNSKGNGR